MTKAEYLIELGNKHVEVLTESELQAAPVGSNIALWEVSVFGTTGSGENTWFKEYFYWDSVQDLVYPQRPKKLAEEIQTFIDSAKQADQAATAETVSVNEVSEVGIVRATTLDGSQNVLFSFYEVYKDKNGVWQKKPILDSELYKLGFVQ